MSSIFVIAFPQPSHAVLAQKLNWLNDSSQSTFLTQPETNINFISGLRQPAFNRPIQNLDTSESIFQVQPETNTNFIAKFTASQYSVLLALRQQYDNSESFVNAAETNRNFIGRFTPPAHSVLLGLRQSLDTSGPVQVQPETNTNTIAKFTDIKINLLKDLRQNYDWSESQFAVQPETNVNFLARFVQPTIQQPINTTDTSIQQQLTDGGASMMGEFFPTTFRLMSAIWRNYDTSQSTFLTQPETNTNFTAKFTATAFNIPPTLCQSPDSSESGQVIFGVDSFFAKFSPSQYYLFRNSWQNQDTSESAAIIQPETNTNLIGRFNVPQYNILLSLRQQFDNSESFVNAVETNRNFIGRFDPSRHYLLRSLWQNFDNSESFLGVQPETNTNFITKFNPQQYTVLLSLRQQFDNSESFVNQPETNRYYIAKFEPAKHYLLRTLWQTFDTSESFLNVQAETNVNFIAKPYPIAFSKVASVTADTSQPVIIQPETNRNFIAPHSVPKFFKVALSSLDSSESGPLGPQPETNVNFLGRFREIIHRILPSLRQAITSDSRPLLPPGQPDWFYSSVVITPYASCLDAGSIYVSTVQGAAVPAGNDLPNLAVGQSITPIMDFSIALQPDIFFNPANANPTLTITDENGVDPNPSSRQLSQVAITTYKTRLNCAISAQIGNGVAGAKYLLVFSAVATNGDNWIGWTHMSCVTPS